MTLEDIVRGQIGNAGIKSGTFEKASKIYKKEGTLPENVLSAVYSTFNSVDLGLIRMTPDREFYATLEAELKEADKALIPLVSENYVALLPELEIGEDDKGNLFGELLEAVTKTPAYIIEGDDEHNKYAKAIKEFQAWEKAAEAGDLKFYSEKSSPAVKKAISLFQDQAKSKMHERAKIEEARAIMSFASENGIKQEDFIKYLSKNITAITDEKDRNKAYAILGRAYGQTYSRKIEEAKKAAAAN